MTKVSTSRRVTLRRAGDLAAIALLIMALGKAGILLHHRLRNPDDWLKIDRIAVPDHVAGADPLVVYDRRVIKPFTATWFAELRELTPDEPAHTVCAGSGESLYEPEEAVGTLPLSTYLGASCDLPPGRYLLRTVWRLENGLVQRHSAEPFIVTEQPE